MYVTIVGVNGTSQTIANVTSFSVNLNGNTGRVNFHDSQGEQFIEFELDKIASITWSRQLPIK